MILTKVVFDTKNTNWTNDRSHSHMFLFMEERYINDMIRSRGYIYLNQIYEALDIEWNPEYENPCIKRGNANLIRFIEFEIFDQPDNSILIMIHHYV